MRQQNPLPFPKPAHYDRDRYQLLLRYIRLNPKLPIQLHNGDCNNEGAISSDMIGMNYAWPEGDYATRQAAFSASVDAAANAIKDGLGIRITVAAPAPGQSALGIKE